MALTNDTGKGGGRGKRGQESNLEARKRTMEEAGSFSSGFSKNWERNYLARRAVCAQRESRLCSSSSGVVFNDGGVVPPACRCESCRQTTPVDGVVPRFACAADPASRISSLSFDGDTRGRMRQFYQAVAFGQMFLWSDVSLRLLADPRAGSEFITWCHGVISVPEHQYASQSCGGKSRRLAPSLSGQCSEPSRARGFGYSCCTSAF